MQVKKGEKMAFFTFKTVEANLWSPVRMVDGNLIIFVFP